MPGTKRKVDEDTWIVSQSKKFKTGVCLANVYETTLAQLRVGARNFFSSLMGVSAETSPTRHSPVASPSSSSSSGSSLGAGPPSSPAPHISPPGSPLVQDVICDNELQNPPTSPVMRPTIICHECLTRRTLASEEPYGKCAYCDKLVCHLNSCRGCGYDFCGGCSIAKYDDSSSDSFECYNCLN